MHPRLLGEERRALERLDDEVVGDVAREAEVDGRVDERLHDEEDVRRAGAGHRRGHRDELLVVDLELGGRARPAARPPGPAGPRSSRASRTRRSCPCRGGPACWACCGRPGRGRGCRSGPRSSPRPGRSGRAGRGAGAGRSRGPTLPSICGLMPEQDDVGALDRLDVGRDGPDAVLAGERARVARAADGWRRPARAPPACRAACPAIMASAMTPEPTVAIVACARGDIARSIAAGSRSARRAEAPPRSAGRRTPIRKKRAVVVTRASRNPAREERRLELGRLVSRP